VVARLFILCANLDVVRLQRPTDKSKGNECARSPTARKSKSSKQLISGGGPYSTVIWKQSSTGLPMFAGKGKLRDRHVKRRPPIGMKLGTGKSALIDSVYHIYHSNTIIRTAKSNTAIRTAK